MIEPTFYYDKKPLVNCVPKDLLMDFSKILNKPYFLFNATWSNTAVAGQLLQNVAIPLDIFNNELARIPFHASTLYRCKLRLIIQVAGTPMHQGTLLASALPAGYFSNYITSLASMNTFMTAPHVFLSANEATPVSLEVPFYVNSKLAKTDLDRTTVNPNFTGTNYAEVGVVVMNPLAAPTSGSTSLTLSFHAEFLDLEFYSPHTDVSYSNTPANSLPLAIPEANLEVKDLQAQGLIDLTKSAVSKAITGVFSTAKTLTGDLLDVLRGAITLYTGLHAPNYPFIENKMHVVNRQMTNLVDSKVQFEKLDPYSSFDRICRDYIFDTGKDEMELRHILQKPQYVGTFVVKSTDLTGALCFSRPITPFQQMISDSYVNVEGTTINTTSFNNNIQTLYYLSKFWRGSLKLHIQASMTNFHYCKLLVAKDYSVRTGVTSGFPAFSSVPNLLTDTLEFSAGGQVHTIDLPFISALEQLPCTTNWLNIVSQHGMYYIYINQPLITNGAVPLSVQFNVYFSAGEDFQYYGYATEPARIRYPFRLNVIPTRQPTLVAQGSIQDAKTIVEVGAQEALTQSKDDLPSENYAMDLRPITHIRDYLRRMYKVARYKYTQQEIAGSNGLTQFDVAELLGVRTSSETLGSSNRVVPASTLRVIQNMFLGYSGGIRIKIIVQGTSGASAWYVPPAFTADTYTGDAVWFGSGPTPNTGSGAVPRNASIAMYTNLKYSANIFDKEFSVQTVLQERPNYKTSSMAGLVDPNNPNLVAESVSELEFEIPNLSPYRFLGDISGKSGNLDAFIRNSPTTNMGHIVLFTPQQLAQGGVVETSGIYVTMFAGADDVARTGYHVFSPEVVIPGTTSTAPGGYQFISTINQPDGFANIPSRNPYTFTNYTKVV